MDRGVCKFYGTPGGCYKGANCTFQHSNTSQQPSNPAQSLGSSSWRNGPGNTKPFSSSGSVPPGVCRFYWTTGNCNRGFQCRYKHNDNPSSVASPAQQQQATGNPSAIDDVAPFLNDAGMAKLTGSRFNGSLNSEKDLSPNEAHNALRRYLHDDFRFRSSVEIYGFVKIINSAIDTNTSWVRSILI